MVTSLKKEIVLTPEQEEAESLIEEWFFHLKTQIFVLCGYAGTGKTALVDYTVRRLGLKAGESAVFRLRGKPPPCSSAAARRVHASQSHLHAGRGYLGGRKRRGDLQAVFALLVHESNTEALKRFKVRREDTVCRFEFAYALTCHKAQGSEYDFVIVLDESNLFENGKEWLYTAIKRAKKRLLIIR